MEISRVLQKTCIYVDPRLETQTFVLVVKLIHVMGGKVSELSAAQSWTHVISESMYLMDERGQQNPDTGSSSVIFVRPMWLEMIYKHNKLYGPEWFSPDPKKIFSGMIVCCEEDIPQSDVELLFSGIATLGGQWRTDYSDDVTHLIMLNTDGSIYNKLKKCDSSVYNKICYILPHYFEDCFRIGRKCDPSFYTFPDPKILSLDPTDLLTVKVMDKDSQGSKQLSFQHTKSMKLLESTRIYIDSSVDSSSRDKITKLVNASPVKIVESIADATMVVCEYRSGNAYSWSQKHKLVIGTSRWALDMLKSQEFLDPTARPLYYPRPSYTLTELQNLSVTVTNYTGQSRVDIAQMALNLGMKFSLQMTKGCTHLICGSPAGQKYSTAIQWNMHIVNHLWLEETYARWVYQREAKPMFVSFPPGLESLVNWTPVDLNIPLQAVQQLQDCARLNGDTCHQYSGIWMNGNAIDSVTMNSAPSTTAMEAEKENRSTTSDQSTSRDSNSDSKPKHYKTCPLTPPRATSVLISRKRLATGTPDIPTVAKQRRLSTTSARKSSPKKAVGIASTTSSNAGPVTPQKKENGAVFILFTGAKPHASALKELKTLGASLCDDIREATHLIALKGARTEKILCAIGRGLPIVTPQWLNDSAAKGKLLDCSKYLLHDPAFEKQHGFQLKKSLEKVKEKGLMLKEYKVYATPNVSPSSEILQRIVQCAGGEAFANESKTRLAATLESLQSSASSHSKTIIVASPIDASYFSLFQKFSVPVYSSELLLTGILRQELELNNSCFRLNIGSSTSTGCSNNNSSRKNHVVKAS